MFVHFHREKTCTDTRTNAHTNARTHASTQTHTHTHARTHAHTHTHAHIHTHAHTHAYTRARARVHIHTYTYTLLVSDKVKFQTRQTDYCSSHLSVPTTRLLLLAYSQSFRLYGHSVFSATLTAVLLRNDSYVQPFATTTPPATVTTYFRRNTSLSFSLRR